MKTICRVLSVAAVGHRILPLAGHPRSSVKRVYIVAGVPPGPMVLSSVARRILSVFRVERVHGVHDLGEIVFRLRFSGLVLNCFESGEEQTDQDRDDRDDD